jgi:hypothetical protein
LIPPHIEIVGANDEQAAVASGRMCRWKVAPVAGRLSIHVKKVDEGVNSAERHASTG